MKSFSSWMVLMLMAAFWILRVMVALMDGLSMDFFLKPLDTTVEIVLLFVTIFSMILVYKRSLLGAALYLITYGLYFGAYIINNVSTIMAADGNIDDNIFLNLAISTIAMILPIVTLMEMLVEKNHEANPINKETDWFYKNKDYERKLDERADKNHYRTL